MRGFRLAANSRLYFLGLCLLSLGALGQDRPALASDAACVTHDETEPVILPDETPSEGNPCGRGTPLLSALAGDKGHFTVMFPQGGRAEFYPMLLTDKPEFKCMKLKLTIGCVSQMEQDGNAFVVKFRTSKHKRHFIEEAVRITPEGITYSKDARYFALVPRYPKNSVGDQDSHGARAMKRAKAFTCDASLSNKRCRSLKNFIAERAMFNVVRTHRMLPKKAVAVRKEDFAHLFKRYDGMTGTRRALHEMIIANEINATDLMATPYVSPFQAVDALDGSGISFGAHQIDIGTNKEDGVRVPFENASRALATRVPENIAKRLQDGGTAFNRPIREFNQETLATFWALEPDFHGELRSKKRREDYYVVYDAFLKSRAHCVNTLRARLGFFKAKPWVALYVMDVAHQYGPGRAVKLAKFAADQHKEGQSAETIEREVLAYMTTGARNGPKADYFKPRDVKEIERRVGNARKAAQKPGLKFDSAQGHTCPAPWLGKLAQL